MPTIIITGKLMKCYVFAYGTLLNENLKKAVLDYKTFPFSARLKGFKSSSIHLSGIQYSILIKDFQSTEIVEEGYFAILEKDLELIDQYESSAYIRTKVKLENGIEAWVYCSQK